MKLYTSPQSSAALRVRIALHLKNLPYEEETIALDRENAKVLQRDFLKLNEEGKVPVLVDGQRIMRQSVAIMEYLDESYPDTLLLPGGNRDRARIRALTQLIVSDIAPLTSPCILSYLQNQLALSDSRCDAWRSHWLNDGLGALEAVMESNPASNDFCHGDIPSMADACLVAQFHPMDKIAAAAERYPNVHHIYQSCMQLDAFHEAVARHGN